jgi:hypothetical protein
MTAKVLIIDEKSIGQKHNSAQLLKGLNEVQRGLVELHESSYELWELNKNEDAIEKCFIDLTQFNFIFLHQSYDDPILSEPRILLDQLPNGVQLVLFSGERSEGLNDDNDEEYNFPQDPNKPHFEIRRSIYFENFPNFLDSYLVSGTFRIEALYDKNFSIKKEEVQKLFNLIKSKLEESEKLAAESHEFSKFFELAGYEANETKKIVENYKTFDHNQFLEALENELSKL